MAAKIQAVASGCLPDIATGRRAVAASRAQDIFEPGDLGYWDDAFADSNDLVRAAGKLYSGTHKG